MIIAMLMFSIFYVAQLPVFAWIIAAMLWRLVSPAPHKARNKSLHHNSKHLMGSKV